MDHITERDVTRVIDRVLRSRQVEVTLPRGERVKGTMTIPCRTRIAEQVTAELARMAARRAEGQDAAPTAGQCIPLHLPFAGELAA